MSPTAIGVLGLRRHTVEWRKAAPYPVDGDPAEVAASEAARLETEYDTAAIKALIDNPEISCGELMAHIPGPDFPTAGMIHGIQGIRDAYETGRGIVRVRARVDVEEDKKTGQAVQANIKTKDGMRKGRVAVTTKTASGPS